MFSLFDLCVYLFTEYSDAFLISLTGEVHSGESDFDPPRFKPEPDVYLKVP